MPKVVKTYTQLKTRPVIHNESSLVIAVDYDPENDQILAIEKITVINHKTNPETVTCITAVLFDMFFDPLKEIIDSIDWVTAYKEQYIPNHSPYKINFK